MKPILFSIATLLFLYGCVSSSYKKSALPKKEIFQNQLTDLIEDSLLSNAKVGVYIESLTDGEVFYQRNESKLFLPASNLKLFTTAVPLEKLGPNYQFKTEIYSSGEIIDSVLHGNLLIRGMGDPSISGRMYGNDVLAIFNNWADSLLLKGIKKVKGDLIGLDGYFTDDNLGKGWNWDDEPYWYSAQIGALSFNDNCIDITLIAGNEIGDSVQLETNPRSDYVYIKQNLTTIHSDSASTINYTRQRAKNIIEMEGGISVGDSLQRSITIEKPSLWFVTILNDVLSKRGIAVDGQLLTGSMPFELFSGLVKKQFTHLSPPLKELIKVVNKASHNFYAEQIFKTLGAELKQNGSAEEGSKVISEWLQELGIDKSLAIIADGSGLSRMNLISPIATAAVLRHMYKSPNFEYFYDSLPIAGIDGTLKGRMQNSIAQEIVRAKTGFVTHARNLAGYTTDRSGKDFIFVIMVNNYSTPTKYINDLQNKIAILLTGFDSDK